VFEPPSSSQVRWLNSFLSVESKVSAMIERCDPLVEARFLRLIS